MIKLFQVLKRKALFVLIVDDYHVIRCGLRTMLCAFQSSYQFTVYEADNAIDALEIVRTTRVDIVIAAYELPKISGAELTYNILIYKPLTLVLGIAYAPTKAMIAHHFEAGARGFILKNISPSELLTAIEALIKGRDYKSFEVLQQLCEPSTSNRLMVGNVEITKREMEVFRLIPQEYSNKEIALILHIEKRTVDNHRQNLIKKLGVKNSIGLVRLAFKYGIC